jgi:dTDP-4-dehydrorhamnose 3,5-epimerase
MDKDIISDIFEFELSAFTDFRGEIYTYWSKQDFQFDINFNHDKFTLSHKNVFRGIHGDFESTKMVTCPWGEIFYVFVDLRKNSKTYMQWDTTIISQSKKNAVIFPPGVASGALTLSDTSVTAYKLSYLNLYPDSHQQFSIKWNHPELDIKWPVDDIILSERDK